MKLFEDFSKVSSKEWKNKIQYELKGADYNDTLVWESLEGIKVKPFYHFDDQIENLSTKTENSPFKVTQRIFAHDLQKTIAKANDVLKRGAEVIFFTVDNPAFDCFKLLSNLPQEFLYIFSFTFLEEKPYKALSDWAKEHHYHIDILTDPIHELISDGNWYNNLNDDFEVLNNVIGLNNNISLLVDASTFQNAGANITQQLAYQLAHLNEYLARLPKLSTTVYLQVTVGANYFFEISKLRAIRLLTNLLEKEYEKDINFKILGIPSKRNKTLYDYNVNMLRTTTESMSLILGGADYISNLAYDSLYHKDNEFGDRIARNQLLVLKHESYLDVVANPSDGAYYIEYITQQLAEKALNLFKQIEASGGLITGLINGTIQRKIAESALKEQQLFDEGKEVLLGTNKYPNKEDVMSNEIELFPFMKHKPRKTLITPIITKRLAEEYEKERLEQEKSQAK